MLSSMFSWFAANKAVVFAGLFGVSEMLALIPGIKANSVFQLVFGWLQKQENPSA